MTYLLELLPTETTWLARLRPHIPQPPTPPDTPQEAPWLEFTSPLALLEWLETQSRPQGSGGNLP